MSEQREGVTKWYNREKGYGFIKGEGSDVFVHANQLRKCGIEDGLTEGQKVSFTIDQGLKGAFATNITKLAD